MDIYQRIMRAVGSEVWAGSDSPPEPKPLRYRFEGRTMLQAKAGDSEYQVICANNDGSELWFGWNNSWKHHMGQTEVRALFWWLLWEWYAKARWFGLRRPIYYWALRRHVARFRRLPAHNRTGASDERLHAPRDEHCPGAPSAVPRGGHAQGRNRAL